MAVVWAQSEGGVRGFLVERGTPGFSAHDIEGKLSLRASVTSELVLDEVRLPDASVLPEAHGLSGPLACLDEARYGICWGVLGAGSSLPRGGDRVRQDAPGVRPAIAGFQLTQAKLARWPPAWSRAGWSPIASGP